MQQQKSRLAATEIDQYGNVKSAKRANRPTRPPRMQCAMAAIAVAANFPRCKDFNDSVSGCC